MASTVTQNSGHVQYGRTALAKTVSDNSDATLAIQYLLKLDTPLTEKFVILNFCDLLARNAQAPDNLKRLIMGLNILEKYVRHLLKPSESRSNMWRHIKYSNSIFRDRVDTIKGGREIMHQMGYTVNKSDGVAFPDDVEPDHDKILNLVVDIILGKKELEAYLNKSHPHPQYIEIYINEEFIDAWKTSSQTSNPQPAVNQEPVTVQTVAGLVPCRPTQALEQAVSQNSPRLVPSNQNLAQRPDSGGSIAGLVPSRPSTVEESATLQTAGDSVFTTCEGSARPEVVESTRDMRLEIEKGKPVDTSSELKSPPRIACDICGENAADYICKVCDNKQLCKDCHIKWHKHPKRQNHKLECIRPQATGDSLMSGLGSSGSMLPSSVAANGSFQQAPVPSLNRYVPQATGSESIVSEASLQSRDPRSVYPGSSTSHQQANNQYNQQQNNPRYSMPPNMVNQSEGHGKPQPSPSPEGNPYYITPINTMPTPAQSWNNPHTMTSQPSMISHMPGSMPSAALYPSSVGMPMPTSSDVRYSMPMYMPYPAHMMPNMYPTHQRQDGQPVSYMGQGQNQGQPMMGNHQHARSSSTDMGRFGNNGNKLNDSRASEQDLSFTNQSSCRPENASTPSTPSSAGSNPSMSHFLPSIMAINDLEKRRARIEVNLMTLKEDTKQWDERINQIILENPDFFRDEELNDLNRRKRRHLQEIHELEKYNKKLNEDIKIKEEKEANVELEKNKIVKEMEALRKRLEEVKGNAGPPVPQPPPVYPNYQQQQLELEQQQQLLRQQQPPQPLAKTGSGMVPVGPENTTYIPTYGIQTSKSPRPSSSSSDLLENSSAFGPPLRISSFGEGDEARPGESNEDYITRMLVLDDPLGRGLKTQEKTADNYAINMNVPLSPPNVKVPPEVSYPPLLNKNDQPQHLNLKPVAPVKHVLSEPDLQNKNTAGPVRKNQSATNVRKWVCEHCTFNNDFDVKACTICFKTSDSPVIVGGQITPPEIAELRGADNQNQTEACEHCTYGNEPGTVICQMCAKTQSKYETRENVATIMREVSDGDLGSAAAANYVPPQQGPEQGPDVMTKSTVGQLITDTQDQVYWEKKAAQEKFDETVKPTNFGAPMETLAVNYTQGATAGVQPTEEGTIKGTSSTSPEHRDLARLRKSSGLDTSSGSSSESTYVSAPTSMDPKPEADRPETQGEMVGSPQGAGAEVPAQQMKAIDSTQPKHPQLDFTEAIEQINAKRAQEQMNLDGHELMSLIKESEKAGYEIEEIEIAMEQSIEDGMKVLDWLNLKWAGMIDLVILMAGDEGKKAEQNCIGDITIEEVKKALLDSKGDVEKSVKVCVEDRAKKYGEVSGCGEFAREHILTALFQNHGNVTEAVDQLNQTLVQGYYDRMWTEDGARGGAMAALAEAALTTDQNNSISNSVIGTDGFLKIVKDTDINKEWRTRMVLVEGKLRSWGRADMVVTILDQYVTLSDEPLECELEDIIEAVRNCGDKRSSLVYLTQECGICYSLFPMSKIRSLGSCECKLCNGCLKQNFEVVIREKYVRNWGCPLCQAPNLEDDEQAQQYFEFLSMMLNTMVDLELMDLFETKLRDWRLHKDENFRWCAHCASGFIWDRPDILGMPCPSCRKKTCFMCKKKWEDQHEGLTCEQFTQWKIDNDPNRQSKGVQVYLEENGIDCPSCKMRYSLAKGGCMHFKCPQCGHEFCSGCYQVFLHQGVCKLLKSCKNKGLHCHHPRDCFYYLRDNDTADLQRLLKNQKVQFNTEPPETQVDKKHCPVEEQKETGSLKTDEACGKDTSKGMAGLCELHYKEYLVGLINKHKIDPVAVMSTQELKVLVQRNEQEPPQIRNGETEANYRKRLAQFVKERFRLPR